MTDNTDKVDKNRGYDWYFFFSYWAIMFFILFKMNIIPFSPYLLYLGIVIFFCLQFLYLIFYQVYYRLYDPQNYNIIREKHTWIIFGGWLLLVFILDIAPLILLKPEINKESTLFSLILGLVYLLFIRSKDIHLGKQYFSKGEKFNSTAEKYSLYEYLLS